MIVNMQAGATDAQIDHVIERIKECGFQAHVIRGSERTVIGCVGSGGRRTELEALLAAPGVEALVPIAHPFKLVSRQLRPKPSEIVVRGVAIGGGRPVVIAGPCSVESREQILETAHAVRAAGADMLRGGAYKPRTSPYDFQGLGEEALRQAELRDVVGERRERDIRAIAQADCQARGLQLAKGVVVGVNSVPAGERIVDLCLGEGVDAVWLERYVALDQRDARNPVRWVIATVVLRLEQSAQRARGAEEQYAQ